MELQANGNPYQPFGFVHSINTEGKHSLLLHIKQAMHDAERQWDLQFFKSASPEWVSGGFLQFLTVLRTWKR